ncbi:unnamed protein product [Meloidogyne enterolobii]|uniref:Uncharacterized protein n=1 Tax=Meloidogyne enterolobii TaxID=390850 RepID=A0ACB1AEG2_MELEN
MIVAHMRSAYLYPDLTKFHLFIVNRGCGKCPSKTCETCNKNRCNDGKDLKYYCKSKKGEKEMIKCDKPECYIKALNEAKNG